MKQNTPSLCSINLPSRRPTTEALTTTTTRPTTTSTRPTTTTTRPRQRPRQRHRPRPPLTLASSSRLAQPLVRPTNLPRHIVHTQADVFPYTQRHRVETEAEVETDAAYTAQTQTEVATHVGIEVLHEADADETGTLIGRLMIVIINMILKGTKRHHMNIVFIYGSSLFKPK